MTGASAYARLRRLGSPFFTTGEAAAALRVSKSSASRVLRRLATEGLVHLVRFGLWSLSLELDPRAAASEITRPYPAYVSFQSALAAHGAIDQLPREIALASLGRPKLVQTALGTYRVHRLPPELFGGFEEREGAPVATPEKALVDYFYVAHASGHPERRLPELELPADFSRRKVSEWLARIRDERLRRRVAASIERALAAAEFEETTRPHRRGAKEARRPGTMARRRATARAGERCA